MTEVDRGSTVVNRQRPDRREKSDSAGAATEGPTELDRPTAEITIWVQKSGVMGSEMRFSEICGGVNDAFTEDY